MKTTALLLGFLGLTTTLMAGHDHQPDRFGGPRVVLYEDANFRGGSLVLYPGERLPDLRQARFSNGKRVNDRISSVRIEGGAGILLYDDFDFDGQVIRVTDDVRNFAHRYMPDIAVAWNDRISSLTVIGERRSVAARPGPPVETVIRRAYLDVLDRPADPDGLAYFRGLMLDQGWTEKMVRDHLLRSDEYRLTTVDRIIGRAYREVLGREPDPQGLANYRRLLLTQHWSETRLRDTLRASAEYRNRRLALR